ncbi:hypothetical protein A6R68_16640 [Neotoma lepida]|uniref:Uncharacterized protein n=1 Tax=Neotoma lepida TaxID=56216 RepID=A0A1A6HF49_NEOLE|nr:hypothetical protein A6R68_16640 [Neotoma lepida]
MMQETKSGHAFKTLQTLNSSLLTAKMSDAAWGSAERQDAAYLGPALAPVLPAFVAKKPMPEIQ